MNLLLFHLHQYICKITLVLVFLCEYFIIHSDGAIFQIPIVENLKSCLNSNSLQNLSFVSSTDTKKYNELNYQWQKKNGIISPLAYILPISNLEISKILNCTRAQNIQIVPKGGAHSFEKYSFGTSSSIVIDLQKLSFINVDRKNKEVEIGPGALVAQIILKIQENGNFFLPFGVCPVVGISGLALGGGYGFFSRKFGLLIDHLVGAEIVIANGTSLKTSSSENSELFWALRGGGSSFGIVTKFIFKLIEAPTSISFIRLHYPLRSFVEIYRIFQNESINSAGEIFMRMETVNKKITVSISQLHQEAVEENSVTEIEKIVEKFPKEHKKHGGSIKEYSYLDFVVEISEINYFLHSPSDLINVSRTTETERFLRTKSFYITQPLTLPQIIQMYNLIILMPPHVILKLNSWGGEINKITKNETAFVHRDAILLFDSSYVNLEKNNNFGLNLRSQIWQSNFFEETKILFGHKESYQNYADGELGDYMERYYGENLKKLQKIKTEIDPHNYFKQPQSIY